VKGRAPQVRPSPLSPLVGEGWGGGYKAGIDSEDTPPCRQSPPSSATVDLPLGNQEHPLALAGTTLLADPHGALFWPDEKLLVVADLHLEKGLAFARRGVLLPPYDTASTLVRLAALIARYKPRLLIALGDSFHDGDGPRRMAGADHDALRAMQQGRDWLWICGNHDPDLAADFAEGIGGRFAAGLALGPLTFSHEPSADDGTGEIAGHLHPMARIAQRGHAVRRRCFAADGRRLVMPAFGAYAGGLNVRDRAISALFGTFDFTAHMLGRRRLYAVAAAHCLAD
jgi:uncharacterized protein